MRWKRGHLRNVNKCWVSLLAFSHVLHCSQAWSHVFDVVLSAVNLAWVPMDSTHKLFQSTVLRRLGWKARPASCDVLRTKHQTSWKSEEQSAECTLQNHPNLLFLPYARYPLASHIIATRSAAVYCCHVVPSFVFTGSCYAASANFAVFCHRSRSVDNTTQIIICSQQK